MSSNNHKLQNFTIFIVGNNKVHNNDQKEINLTKEWDGIIGNYKGAYSVA